MAKANYAGTLSGVVVGFLWVASASAASFMPLGFLPGFADKGAANAVSGDGSSVTGTVYGSPDGIYAQAFRWTAAEGMQGLGYLPNFPAGNNVSSGVDISADGLTVAGLSSSLIGYQAYQWTGSGGITGLGNLNPTYRQSVGRGISGDGAVIVGDSLVDSGTHDAFRWTLAGGMQDLGEGSAKAANYDGSVIAGNYTNSFGESEAFRWTAGQGIVGLGRNQSNLSVALGVSGDGSVIVGYGSSGSSPRQAFRWTESTGMAWLEPLPPAIPGEASGAVAHDVCGNGSIMVGLVERWPLNERAAIWTSPDNPQLLSDYLVSGGATGLSGWTLNAAVGISADCTTVVGYGLNPQGHSEAFVANIAPVPIPPAVWLLGTALAGLGGRRWLRRKITTLS